MGRYRPKFRKQLTGSACEHANCNMAVSAMLADQYTLGLVQKTADQMRTLSGTAWECSDRDPRNDQTSQQDAARALAKVGVRYQFFDSGDGKTWSDFVAALKVRPVSISLDYDTVPYALKGDKAYLGLHQVYGLEFNAAQDAILVFDPLADGRRAGIPVAPDWWPRAEVRQGMEKLDAQVSGRGLQYGYAAPIKLLTGRIALAPVRATPSATGLLLGTTGASRYQWAGPVTGVPINTDARWYRIWFKTRIGFIHASHVSII